MFSAKLTRLQVAVLVLLFFVLILRGRVLVKVIPAASPRLAYLSMFNSIPSRRFCPLFKEVKFNTFVKLLPNTR